MYTCFTNLFVFFSNIAALQIALWEEYSCKLEIQVHVLTGENDTLQKRLAAVQGSLADGGACPTSYALHSAGHPDLELILHSSLGRLRAG